MKTFFAGLLMLALWVSAFPRPAAAQNSRVRMEMVNSYPELRVDNRPFFVHSAAFFYPRIPRDQWENSLRRHRELGINTLDLYIPWNWHEPREGQLDFDGHTSPRRDLQGLLKLISDLGFHLIIRPGPVILNEWKNGGYPDWLLTRPEYREKLQDVLEGRYPRLSELTPTRSEEASQQWLQNATHLRYTKQWFFEVMKILSPYLASQGGNILFFQLDDDQAINRTNYNGPNFWKYMETLEGYLREAAVAAGGRADDVIPFINPTDMRVSAAGFGLHPPIAALGQWYMNSGIDRVTLQEAAQLQFFVEELKTEPRFPPMMIEFQAGWYAPGEDEYAKPSAPVNTLLASRTLIADGLRGLSYFPLQDTLYPAGYEVPWVNHYYAWDAAMDINSNVQGRIVPVWRNRDFLRGMGTLLAQTHKQADVGIVYSLGALQPQEKLSREDVLQVSNQTVAVQRYCALNHVSTEYVDPEYQPADQLQRDKILLMPVIDLGSSSAVTLAPTAESRLIEYVQQGGTLMFFPRAPRDGMLGKWFSSVRPEAVQSGAGDSITIDTPEKKTLGATGALEIYAGVESSKQPDGFRVIAHLARDGKNIPVALEKRVGEGRVIVLGMDFYSWVSNRDGTKSPDRGIHFNVVEGSSVISQKAAKQDDRHWVIEEILSLGSVDRSVRWKVQGATRSDAGIDVQLESSDACEGFGFLSAINYSRERERTVDISLGPHNACLAPVQFPVIHLPPQEALFLPVHLPLEKFLGGAPGGEVVASNAELLDITGTPDHFQMKFYAPRASEVWLKLSHPKAWRFTSEKGPLEARLDSEHGWLQIPFSKNRRRGPRPTITAERVDKDPLRSPDRRSPPQGDEKEKKKADFSAQRKDEEKVRISLRSSFLLPIRDQLSLPLEPPILVLDSSGPSRLMLELNNPTPRAESYSIDIKVNGYHLTPSLKKVSVGANSVEEYEFTLYLFLKGILDPKEKVSSGEFLLKSRHGIIEKNFLMVTVDHGSAVAYAMDLDRDGAPEVVLENSELRLIVTPDDGARSFVLWDKRSQKNIFSNVGSFRDRFLRNDNRPTWTSPRQMRGYFGLFNRPYHYKILASGGETAKAQFSYDAPDVLPAGARIVKTITLNGSLHFFEVEYKITPHRIDAAAPQAFISVNSVNKQYLEGPSSLRLDPLGSTLQQIDHIQKISRENSGELDVFFKPFTAGETTYSYRIRYELPMISDWNQ